MTNGKKVPFEALDITNLCSPGVYRFECIPKNCAFFGVASEDMFGDLKQLYYELKNKVFHNSELVKDFHNFGMANFHVTIIAIGYEYVDPLERNKALENAKAQWTGSFY